jgi:hypothetical protein
MASLMTVNSNAARSVTSPMHSYSVFYVSDRYTEKRVMNTQIKYYLTSVYILFIYIFNRYDIEKDKICA